MKQNCLILYSNSYSYMNREGRLVEGLYIDYIYSDNLEQKEDSEAIARGDIDRGYRTANNRLPYTQKNNIKTVPGIYELTFKMDIDRNRNATTVPIEVKFIHEVKLSPVNQK